jgi:hypothetical protein
MFQKTSQWFVDRLVERFLPAIGSFMASALQRMLILGHVEHHNQLEEQARRYEAAGKPHLAAMIREQSQALTLEEPMADSPNLLERVASPLPEVNGLPAIGVPDRDAQPRRSRRHGKTATQDGKPSQQDATE